MGFSKPFSLSIAGWPVRQFFKSCFRATFFPVAAGAFLGWAAFEAALIASDAGVTCDTTATYACVSDFESEFYCFGFPCSTANVEKGRCVVVPHGPFRDCSQIQDTSPCAGVCVAGPFAGLWCPLRRPPDACRFP